VFYNSKKSTMLEQCSIAASNVSSIEVLSITTIDETIGHLSDKNTTRTIVTDENCNVLYDSASKTLIGKYLLYPEVITCLSGNTVFRWHYDKGIIRSFVATPIVSHGKLIGCVYMNEYDAEQGALLQALQRTVFFITLFLEIIIILVSVMFSRTYSYRLGKVMRSIRNVRDGDYSHKLSLSGNDELNILGNEFNELVDRLDTSEKKRNRFVSDASHELKTPLASIKLLSDSILQNDMDPDTIKEFVGDIGNEAERLNRLSQKLLTLSRIDSNAAPMPQVTQVFPIVQRVARMLQPTATKQNIQISIECNADISVSIAEDDLYQVIFNLIENGIKYNKADGVVSFTANSKTDTVQIQISDTGVGIPSDSLSHIFERFYRVDKARSRSTGGSGLGLSIVRNIVKQNRGTIHVESRQNIGTTITITLPKNAHQEVSQ